MLVIEFCNGQPSHWQYAFNPLGYTVGTTEIHRDNNWSQVEVTWEMSDHYQNMIEAHSDAEADIQWRDSWFSQSIARLELDDRLRP